MTGLLVNLIKNFTKFKGSFKFYYSSLWIAIKTLAFVS